LEGDAARAIEGAFRELIEHRYLCQKLIADLRPVDEAVKEAIKDATIRAITPGAAAGGALASETALANKSSKEVVFKR
jgi:hypothetical protein